MASHWGFYSCISMWEQEVQPAHAQPPQTPCNDPAPRVGAAGVPRTALSLSSQEQRSRHGLQKAEMGPCPRALDVGRPLPESQKMGWSEQTAWWEGEGPRLPCTLICSRLGFLSKQAVSTPKSRRCCPPANLPQAPQQAPKTPGDTREQHFSEGCGPPIPSWVSATNTESWVLSHNF